MADLVTMSVLAHRGHLLHAQMRMFAHKCQLVRFVPEDLERAAELQLTPYLGMFLFKSSAGGWGLGPLLAHETDELVLERALRGAEADIQEQLSAYRDAVQVRRDLETLRQRVMGVVK